MMLGQERVRQHQHMGHGAWQAFQGLNEEL